MNDFMFNKEVKLLSIALRLKTEWKLTKASAKILTRAFFRIGAESPRFIKWRARG